MKAIPLLDRVGAELDLKLCWSDVVIVRNVGPLQTTVSLEGDLISNRGFNALVFGTRAAPARFLKVRPAVHALFQSEAEITVRLSISTDLRGLVPISRTFVDGPARVLVQEYLDGHSMAQLLGTRHRRDWPMVAAEVIRTARPMWDAIVPIVGHAQRQFADPALLIAYLSELRALGLEAEAARALAQRIEGSMLPAQPQHGDFWPRNVLRAADGWKVLDFESCGSVALPLYDVFHMVRGCSAAARAGQESWIERWHAASGARALATEVRRAAGGLSMAEIEVALIAYLVDFAARLSRRGLAPVRFADRLRELNALPELLERGTLRRLLE